MNTEALIWVWIYMGHIVGVMSLIILLAVWLYENKDNK